MLGTEQKLLRADNLGRVRTPADRRQSLIEEYERSGLSGAKFAALAGIKYPTFAAWLQKHRRQQGSQTGSPAQASNPVRWLEAVVEEAQNERPQSAGTLTLELPGGARMHIHQVNQAPLAAALIRALEKPC